MGTAAIRSREGSALVIVLALLVLLTGIVLAFFSRAVDQRRVSAVSAADSETRLFADSAAEMVVGDLRQEMAAGSRPDTLADSNPSMARITDPEIVTIGGQSIAPGIVPQKVASAGDGMNIVKKSLSGKAFYTAAGWYASATSTKPTPADGPVRASSVSTSTASLKGRAVSLQRWKLPKLLTPTEEGTFAAPDWIYVNRSGANPADLSAAGLPALANSSPDNTNHVIGRYAYVVYDLGGLMDINVVGNALTSDENARRGGLHQVSLAGGLAGVTIPNFADFVAWRSAASQANSDATLGGGGLFDPQRTFLQVEAGDQAFLNRQDLIKYTEPAGSLIPSALLPYLTTFTRDFNGPVLRPDPLRSKTLDLRFPPPTPPTVDEINPDALTVRFGTETKLSRGSVDPATVPTVPAGTPVMPRKFPLSKIDLLAEAAPNADMLKYYFGLKKRSSDGVFEYDVAGPGGSILTLKEVAALPPDPGTKMKREPNFFEALQASILTGSLAKSALNTYNYGESNPDESKFLAPSSSGQPPGPGPDTLQRLQIFRIGANIIDQWDADNAPTRIESPSGVPTDPLRIYGIENLPYVSQVSVVAYRPADDLNNFQVWAVFDVWNPHQNAKPQSGKPLAGVTGFRIVPVSGRGRALAYYRPTFFRSPSLMGLAGTTAAIPFRTLLAVNLGRPYLNFPVDDYSEPKKIGVAPGLGGGVPGILLNEEPVGLPIPPRGLRSSLLQEGLNAEMFGAAPIKPNPPVGYGISPSGEYVYPSGTAFDPPINTQAWQVVDTGSEIRVSANFGIKAYNYMRLWIDASQPYVFDVQAEIDGKWVTTQRLGGWFRESDGPVNAPERTVDDLLMDTQDGVDTRTGPPDNPDNVKKGFYVWMARGGSTGMIRSDPRTTRLGSDGVNAWENRHPSDLSLSDFTGFSVRSSTAPVPTPMTAVVRYSQNWIAGTGNHTAGTGFEFASTTLGYSYTFGYAANTPDALNASHPMRYSDPDGTIRPGDAYFGGYPLVPGHLAERPAVLNRPFRSVAEMGYAFRDVPWKTLDFFTWRSGDLGLLGAFSISDPEADPPVVAGKVNLNTPHAEVLSAVMQGTARQLPGMDGSLIASEIDADTADDIAAAIVLESQQRPFLSAGDLITRVLNPATGTSPLPATEVEKSRREAAVRALAGVGSTRTWNFLIDVISQTGRFTARSEAAKDFMVQGETHLWVQVAIDRFTGQVVAKQVEVVND